MPTEYKLRRRFYAPRNCEYASIGCPPWVLQSYLPGQKFTWEQLADGRLVATPVRVEFQPPGTREPGSRRR